MMESALREKTQTATMTAVREAEEEISPLQLASTNSAFAVVYQEEKDRLVRFMIKFGASKQDADDAAHEAFVEAYRNWDKIEHPKAWLRKVAVRSYRKMRITYPVPVGYDTPDPRDGQMEMSDQTRLVYRAIASLPELQRLVFAWRYDGFTSAEVAEALGITSDAERQAYMRARHSLKRSILGGEAK